MSSCCKFHHACAICGHGKHTFPVCPKSTEKQKLILTELYKIPSGTSRNYDGGWDCCRFYNAGNCSYRYGGVACSHSHHCFRCGVANHGLIDQHSCHKSNYYERAAERFFHPAEQHHVGGYRAQNPRNSLARIYLKTGALSG